MILSWFDARHAKEFGASLANFWLDRIPVNQHIDEKKFAVKTQKTLEQMAQQIIRFRMQHGLNTYKKAQLGNAFKWALKDAGLGPTQIAELTKWLMLRLS